MRRRAYNVFKSLHHVGFWGFMIFSVAHHWIIFYLYLPGMLLYAVDGVYRLHQATLGRGVDARKDGGDPAAAATTTTLLQAEVDASGTVCTLVMTPPVGFTAPCVGKVWLNVPSISLTQWHPFDCTAVKVAAVDGGSSSSVSVVCTIKAYNRWVWGWGASWGACAGLWAALVAVDTPPPKHPAKCCSHVGACHWHSQTSTVTMTHRSWVCLTDCLQHGPL